MSRRTSGSKHGSAVAIVPSAAGETRRLTQNRQLQPNRHRTGATRRFGQVRIQSDGIDGLRNSGLDPADNESKIITASKQMQELFAYARRVAGSDAKVLITGESGVGKDVIARYIHEHSPRRAASSSR